jgi:hypothetical protein
MAFLGLTKIKASPSLAVGDNAPGALIFVGMNQ